MFLDDTHQWPRDEQPSRGPRPRRGGQGKPARLFLVLALTAAFLPFSLASLVDIIRYLTR